MYILTKYITFDNYLIHAGHSGAQEPLNLAEMYNFLIEIPIKNSDIFAIIR